MLGKSQERFLPAKTPLGMTAQFLGPRTVCLKRQAPQKQEAGSVRGFRGLEEGWDGRNDVGCGRLHVELIG